MQIKIEVPKFRVNAAALGKLDMPKILQQEALNVRARIVADTTAGRKAEGGGLKPYSASYKAAIDSGSVAGKSPGNHTVNLTATGTLLRSLQVRAIEGGAEIAFEGTHPPARRVSSAGAQRKRKTAEKARAAQGLGPLGGHVRNATQSAAPAERAKSARIRGKHVGGDGGKKTGPRRARGGGGDVANAVIAKAQYDMGRDGWFTISKKDVDGIVARLSKRIDEILKSLVAER